MYYAVYHYDFDDLKTIHILEGQLPEDKIVYNKYFKNSFQSYQLAVDHAYRHTIVISKTRIVFWPKHGLQHAILG